MKATNKLATIAMSAVMVMTLGAFTGCNSDEANEQVIRESLTQELDPYKNHDASVINQIRSANAVELATIGIDGEEYATALLDGFDYSIEDVAVDGDQATVTLIMTQKNISEDDATAIMEELAADPAFLEMDIEARKAQISDKIFEYIESVQAAPQDPVTIDLVLNGNMWELTDESEAKMENLFTF